MLEAGRLDKRVTLQQDTASAQNTLGETVPSWSTVAAVWAEIAPIRGREYFAGQQLQAEVTHKVTLRYRSGVSAKMRLLYGARVFRIEAVMDPLERHELLELMCVEILS